MHPPLEIAAVTSERTYVLPHPALRTAISHYTLFRPGLNPERREDAGQLNIVPDASGCIVCAAESGDLFLRFWGPTSRVVAVKNGTGVPPVMLFVEFLPCGANRLLDAPMHLWHNAISSLDDMDAALAAMFRDGFEKYCASGPEPDYPAFMRHLDRVFLARLEENDESVLARHVVASVSGSGGLLRVGGLSRSIGYSERHLNRVAAERIGIGVKLLSRIVRINAACQAMLRPDVSLTALAHGLDYHDQAHFIRDFKAVCGVSPGSYLDRMSDFYNEELKMGGIIPGR